MSIKSVLFGAAAMSLVSVLRLLAQFFALPVLARMLSPEEYGLVGMAMPFLLFAMLLADSGLGSSLVRTAQDRKVEWSTCFWISVFFGTILALLLCGVTPFIVNFYGDHRLTNILYALSLVVFLQSIILVPVAALQQKRKFGIIAISDLASILTGIATALFLAFHGYGVWALVGQQLAQYIVKVVLNLGLSPFRPQFLFSMADIESHIKFGRNVLGASVTGFILRSMDNLVIGKVQNADAVGVYTMAGQFLRLPGMVVTGPLQYTLYSFLAPLKDERERVKTIFDFVTRILSTTIFPGMCMIAVAHEPIFHLLLSEKWYASGQIFSIMAPAFALMSVMSTGDMLMMVFGRTDIQFRMTTEFGILALLMLLGTVHAGGLFYVAVGYSAVVFVYAYRRMSLVMGVMKCSAGEFFKLLLIPVLVSGVGVALYLLTQSFLGNNVLFLTLYAATIATIMIGIAALFQRQAFVSGFKAFKAETHHA